MHYAVCPDVRSVHYAVCPVVCSVHYAVCPVVCGDCGCRLGAAGCSLEAEARLVWSELKPATLCHQEKYHVLSAFCVVLNVISQFCNFWQMQIQKQMIDKYKLGTS